MENEYGRFNKFITLRRNPFCGPGQWWISDGLGEPLYQARVTIGPKGAKIERTGSVSVEFDQLAPFIVEHGFTVAKEDLVEMTPRKNLDLTPVTKEHQEFRNEFDDIIDDQVQTNIEQADPSYKKKSGVTVIKDVKNESGKKGRK